MRIYWRLQHWRFLQFKFRTAEISNAATSNKFLLCCLCFLWLLLSVPGFAQSDKPTPRTDQNSLIAHSQLLEKAEAGRIDIYFEGDSITRRWGATDYPELLANWKQNFFGWNAADFGWGADRVENILWRLEQGELDNVHPKIIVLLAGTNNVGRDSAAGFDDASVADITRGLEAVIATMRAKAPEATIILTAIFPRNDNIAVMPTIDRINDNLSRLAGPKVRYLNINDRLAEKNGRLFEGMMNPDKLHPAIKGYQVWADALKPVFLEILGPPAQVDQGPPPTGDPSAQTPK
jgi:lysophospholipase L1-like esterase